MPTRTWRFSAVMKVPRNFARAAALPVARAAVRRWPPRSRLFVVGDEVGWAIDYETAQVREIARDLGIRIGSRKLIGAARDQAAFFGSQFALLHEPWQPPPHALACAYFHGLPGTAGMPEFDECYEMLRQHHPRVDRVQVSHSQMHDVVLSTGIDPVKVFRIPIAVDPELFVLRTAESCAAARAAYGLPDEAYVVGSFVKDGTGFGDGFDPKWIKGPDVLLKALTLAHERLPELHVLLSGPARGFVRRGLEQAGIPNTHILVEKYEELPRLYHAVDACLIASRQEGGPKAVLEAMATGVPLITTRVGQAMDMVRDRENGWIVEVEDVEGLAEGLGVVHAAGEQLASVVAAGRRTAESNSYRAQVPLWSSFFDGFVSGP